jgi:hypothetical protein
MGDKLQEVLDEISKLPKEDLDKLIDKWVQRRLDTGGEALKEALRRLLEGNGEEEQEEPEEDSKDF